MIFNFCIYSEQGGSNFGLISAETKEEAETLLQTYVGEGEQLNVEHGAEDLLLEQYGGLAFLSTGD